jgi:hypothetical protein
MSEPPTPYIIGNIYHVDFRRGHLKLSPVKVLYNGKSISLGKLVFLAGRKTTTEDQIC